MVLYDRQSRVSTFWNDRAVADERARSAAEGREVLGALGELERAAEAAEDLAYEAWYARTVADAVTLGRELDTVEDALAPLVERLYGSLFPTTRTVTLFLVAGRGGWPHLCSLVEAYRAWLAQRDGSLLSWIAREYEPTPTQVKELERSDSLVAEKEAAEQPGARARKGPKRRGPKRYWKWVREVPVADDARITMPGAVAVQASGARALRVLDMEHGSHRFIAGGETSMVKVFFEPRALDHFGDPLMLDARPVPPEVRRVRVDKGMRTIVRDLRTGADHPMDGTSIDLEALATSWLRFRLFGAGDLE